MGTRWIIAYLLLATVGFSTSRVRTSDKFIEKLLERVSIEQVLKDQPYKIMKSWQKRKGTYSSHIVQNFHGKFMEAEARRHIRIFDNNVFVMSQVTSSLIEACKYVREACPSNEHLLLTINALSGYQDKNEHYNTSIMSFWQQQFNESTHYWEAEPVNFIEMFHILDSLPVSLVERILKALGLKQLAKYLETLMEQKGLFLQAIHIPPDFDDTFVNLALGSLMLEQKEHFPDVWTQWSSQNTNITSVFDALKMYAYRPFSRDRNWNSIDPRSYFHIRAYLDQAWTNKQDVALVPTWVQSIEELRKEYYLGVAMPFHINNIDATVSANVIYGVTSAVLSGLVGPDILEDPTIAQIYHNTSTLIVFEIRNNFTGRPDLALTYYPSRLEFYWFVSRTVSILESARRRGPLPLKIMETVYRILTEVVEGDMTKDILRLANRKEAGYVYFDDFLGNGDVTYNDRPLMRGEDRMFTTSMAANALMSAWTYYEISSGKSRWKNGTPWSVRETVIGCIKWLRQHTFDRRYEPWNAFFSGSVKGFESFPFWFPGNRLEYLNGAAISDWSHVPNSTFIYAVQGYVPANTYSAMLKEKHFGISTPMTFHGYNNGSSAFPFWSSTPYTYSTTLLAVSKFKSII